MMIVPVMLQIGSYCNNNFIINVIFFKIKCKGRDKFSAFCYFCNPKQRKNELTRMIRYFMLQIGS